MSKMFSTFRKRQKAMMAVLGIACMIAFALSAMVTPGGGSTDRRSDNRLIATSKIENLYGAKVDELRAARQMANAYMRELLRQFGLDPQRGFFGPDDTRDVVRTYLLSKRAQQLGIEVNAASIYNFLDSQFGRSIKSEQYRNALRALQNRANEQYILDAIRTELLAQLVQQQFSSSVGAFTPLERWNYFRRFQIQAEVEVFPYPVKKVVDEGKVPEPTEEQVVALYEKYKNFEPIPGSPEPGFRVPAKVKLQYVEFDREILSQEELAKITPADVKARYDEVKDLQYVDLQGPASELAGTPVSDRKSDKTKKSPPSKETDKEKEKDGPSDAAASGDAEKEQKAAAPPDGDTKGEAPPTDGETGDAQGEKNGEKKDNDSDKDKKDGASFRPGSSQSGALIGMRSPGEALFGALQADEPASKDERSSGDEAAKADTSEEAPEAAPSKTDGEGASAAAAEEKENPPPANNEEAAHGDDEAHEHHDEAHDHAHADEDESSQVDDEASDKSDKDSSTEKTPVRRPKQLFTSEYRLPPDKIDDYVYFPLSEVYSEIATTLAQERLGARMDKAAKELLAPMQKYYSARKRHKANKKRKEPELLNLAELAKQQPGKYVETGPLTAFELAKLTGIGEANIVRDSATEERTPFRRSANVVQFAFNPAAEFMPVEAEGTTPAGPTGNIYVLWRVEYAEAYTPDLADIRDQVAAQWKIIEAREPARREAESLVAKAKEAEKPLVEVFGPEVKTTGSFSWWAGKGVLGASALEGSTELDEVSNVVDVGDEFMQKVLETPTGGVAFALNKPQTIAYVFRVIQKTKVDPRLERRFMSESSRTYFQARQADFQRINEAWFDRTFNDEIGLEWAIPEDETTNAE